MASNPSKILLLLITFIPLMVPSEAQSIYQINLINASEEQTLTATCKSSRESAKTFTMIPSAKDSFGVHVEAGHASVARCVMRLEKLYGDFVLFDFKRDESRCVGKACVWRINQQGLFFLANNTDFVLEFRWP